MFRPKEGMRVAAWT